VDSSSTNQAEAKTAADALKALRDALDVTLGSAAAATLLRRAARRAEAQAPELRDLSITRDQFCYLYKAPASWNSAPCTGAQGLHELARELAILLEELTGGIVMQHLRSLPELQGCALFPEEENSR
jgi:hypothetical protein